MTKRLINLPVGFQRNVVPRELEVNLKQRQYITQAGQYFAQNRLGRRWPGLCSATRTTKAGKNIEKTGESVEDLKSIKYWSLE